MPSTPRARAISALAMLLALTWSPPASAEDKRAIGPDDVFSMRVVDDPQRSPDGAWVAYTVAREVKETDKNDKDVWMARWDGSREIQLTSTPGSESRPRWSPDDHYLAFVSARSTGDSGAKDDDAQVWLLDRAGGEAVKVTSVDGGVSDYAWSPDSKRLVLVVDEEDPAEAAEEAAKKAAKPGAETPPKPIVIDRWYFKEDRTGYLRGGRSHLFLFDLASRKAERLTGGDTDEESPEWSPDGKRIAYVSRHGEPTGDRDVTANKDVFVVEATANATPRRLTTDPAEDTGPLGWSPDGATISYVTNDEPKLYQYSQERLAVVPAAGGAPRVLTAALDRAIESPVWSSDGSSILFAVEDDRSVELARIAAAGGAVERLTEPGRVVADPYPGKDGGVALLLATDESPSEVYAWENGKIRPITHRNDEWLRAVTLAKTIDFASTSADGTEVHGVLVQPPGFDSARRYPALLRIHGGPDGQDEHAFSLQRQVFAARGYVVLAVNYRGSEGRGSAYQKAIFADWGNKEVIDLHGAVDELVRMGIADPKRLGVGGWSYGGILTDYLIASDDRFRAATSGAGMGNAFGLFGVDMYVQQYDLELGPPWKSPDIYIKISYPLLHADRIHTPTLFLGGEKDFNVPLAGSEQMYEALRTLGVPSQLVIYPGQYHGITRPSFGKDVLERYLAWYDKYLQPR